MDIRESIAKHSQGAAQRLQVRSALNPILWLIAVILPICLIGAYYFKDSAVVLTVLLIAGLIPVAVGCYGFIYLLHFKTDKLQSEDYQLRQQAMQTISEKTAKINPEIAETFVAMANIGVKQIEGQLREDERR